MCINFHEYVIYKRVKRTVIRSCLHGLFVVYSRESGWSSNEGKCIKLLWTFPISSKQCSLLHVVLTLTNMQQSIQQRLFSSSCVTVPLVCFVYRLCRLFLIRQHPIMYTGCALQVHKFIRLNFELGQSENSSRSCVTCPLVCVQVLSPILIRQAFNYVHQLCTPNSQVTHVLTLS